MLGHHGRAVIPHICYFNAPIAAVVQIAVVKACGELADQLYIGRVTQGFLPQGRFVGDDNIRIFYALPDLVNSDSIVINGDIPQLADAVHGHIRSHAVSFQDYYLHFRSPWAFCRPCQSGTSCFAGYPLSAILSAMGISVNCFRCIMLCRKRWKAMAGTETESRVKVGKPRWKLRRNPNLPHN